MPRPTYKDAGVDLEAYRDAMARLPHWLRRTHSPRVLQLEGGFAGLFRLDFPGELFARKYRDPVLVACTDGVGTKLKVAQQAGIHNTVGIDLVAMCVNDAVCCGAEPLFFLDYIALGKDDPPLVEQLVAGISDGCLQCDSALIGGETAIMPDLYAEGDYDLAGFCVGVAPRDRVIDGSSIADGDAILGVASSGFHSNGYSLIRKIVFEQAGLDVGDMVPHLEKTVADLLLTPTRIYTRAVAAVLDHYRVKNVVHGIAHITGGGIAENLARILPSRVSARLNRKSWPAAAEFQWLEELGGVEREEMYRVFNMGLGLLLVVSSYYAESIRGQLIDAGYPTWVVGATTAGDGGVVWADE